MAAGSDPLIRAKVRSVVRGAADKELSQRLLSNRISKGVRHKLRWRSEHRRWLDRNDSLRLHHGSVMHPLDARLPSEITAANAELILDALDDLDIPYTEVRNAALARRTIAIPNKYRATFLRGLDDRYGDEAVYASALLEYEADDAGKLRARPAGPLLRERRPVGVLSTGLKDAAAIRVWKFYLDQQSGFIVGPNYGCDIEFWQEAEFDAIHWLPPRVNVAGEAFSSTDVALIRQKRQLRDVPSSVFELRMIDDIDFPIDVIYTWVDSGDPRWRRKFESYSGRTLPEQFHEQASGDQRFRSRDELKYSLRSIAMYAPWVRHIYIVTDDQVPDFIDFDKDGITIVDHSEIARSPEALPVFNSSAIISWLHRVPGLSEHYIYMNDDVFIGRDVTPGHFFTPGGLAKVFPSKNRRPFGAPSPLDEPHVNITRNIRALLEQEFDRSISQSVKHTPHAQLVSVQYEMEKRFPDAYDRTSRSRFRHHQDIAADQLFHYYAQMIGRAVVGNIRYAYVNIGDRRNEPELERLLKSRNREVFCLNDAPEDERIAMTDATVRGFLEAYYPVPSRWERRPA